MHRLRSQSALQDNSNVLKAVNLNKVCKKENVSNAAKKKDDTNTIVGHLYLNLKTKVSNRKTSKSNKENLAVPNNENGVTENSKINTLKTASSTSSQRKQSSKSKAKCAPVEDETAGYTTSRSRKDSKPKKSNPSCLVNITRTKSVENDGTKKKLRTLRPRNNNLPVAGEKTVSIVKQPSFKKTGNENCGKTKIVEQSSCKVGKNKLKKIQSDSKLKVESDQAKKENIENKKCVSKRCGSFKSSKIDSYLVKKPALPNTNILVKHYPIWKREPKSTSKRKSEYDVYDILQDEDMASETLVKVKRRRVRVKTKTKIKKTVKPKEKNANADKDTKEKISDIADIDSDEIPMDLQQCELEVLDHNFITALTSPSKQVPGNSSTVPETVLTSPSRQRPSNPSTAPETEFTSPAKQVPSNLSSAYVTALTSPSKQVPINPSTVLETVLASPSKQVPSNPSTAPETVVSNLLKELDESFPKTSTPQKRSFVKTLDLLGRNLEDASIIAELSCIPNTNPRNLAGAIFQTPKVSPKRHTQQKNPIFSKKSEFKYEFEINLFESPPKDLGKKKVVKKPRKMVLDLSETKCKKLSNDEPDCSLLKPRKSYLSPDLVTKHISKTKRAVIPQKQKPAQKSKQELLIEKMNKEFDDISTLELCIE